MVNAIAMSAYRNKFKHIKVDSVLYRYLVVFFCNVFVAFANPYMPYKANNTQRVQQDIMPLLQQCSNGIKDSCSLLLKQGVPSVNECEIHICHIIGATLSANGSDREAIPYLQKSCQSSEKLGCSLLGLLYQMSGNTDEAEIAYNTACNNADVIGCYNMGVLQSMRTSSNVGGHAALQSFTRACSMQYPQACFNLAVVYANYKKDFANALYFFHIACDYGMMESCRNMRLLKDSGITLPLLQKKRGLYVRLDSKQRQ
ncbi:tetratricopeptide repeat protein [Helicobacter bilis]|uniref:Beta-lactamase n=1 Tax=Helicobacter bilis TaxID=37372 RepID=A0A4U8U9G0_9HELI|nr:tetratricopeptide repeat protein [Helicobacter bilis]TLE11192.1 sel1 repeat family protein [Helicobacter bilis]